jgi:hypothetical protein
MAWPDQNSVRGEVQLLAVHGPSDWRTFAGEMPALKSTAAYKRRSAEGMHPDVAVVEALRWAIGELPSTWAICGLDYFGLTDRCQTLSETERCELAGQAHGHVGSWFRKQIRAEFGNRTAREKLLDDVAKTLTDPNRQEINARASPSLPDVGLLNQAWGWSEHEPPRNSFRQWEPQATQQPPRGAPSWETLWSRSYLAFDERDSRRQHYLWTSQIRARADGLSVYPKQFEWTGSGPLERLTAHLPRDSKWLGHYTPVADAEHPRWAYHLFYLGRPYNAGDELVVQFSETWFDRDHFFSPFLRTRTVGPAQAYTEVAIRFSERLRPSALAEMEWTWEQDAAIADQAPLRVASVEPTAGEWHGIHVPRPAYGKSYGLQWRSEVYDGLGGR